jgi:hypothetical protein
MDSPGCIAGSFLHVVRHILQNVPHPLEINLCACCDQIAGKEETLCYGCKAEAYVMRFIHLVPESDANPEPC